MKKSFWLSYDLGIKGDYESLYVWLANLDAVECGDCTAYFVMEINKNEDPIERLKKDLEENVTILKNERIYVVWREGSRVRGRFIFGTRKAPPWAGYGPFQPTTEEST